MFGHNGKPPLLNMEVKWAEYRGIVREREKEDEFLKRVRENEREHGCFRIFGEGKG